ncbi:GNAT family N-acetyltransferase [Staphylococcus sp. GSSP0090]|nr:GNAT family N-acetyltransferase [Staphylococcus sp. GSSP0090]
MNRLTIEQTQFINQIAEVHEMELERQNTLYKKTKLSVALRIEMIERGLKYNEDAILIQTQEEQLVGFIWARYDKSLKTALIEILYVVPTHRNQGIATTLKKEIEAWARNKGAHKIESTVAYSNKIMQKMNFDMGYDMDKVVMVKNLLVNNEDKHK